MNRPLLILLMAMLWVSCGKKLLETPDNLIPRERMVDILYEMAVLDALDNSHPQVLVENNIMVMPYLFDKYGVDSLQFVQSDLYYASVPEEYEKIYKAVEERLSRKRDSVSEAIRQVQSAGADSLKASKDYRD